jgi:hypothetical protein
METDKGFGIVSATWDLTAGKLPTSKLEFHTWCDNTDPNKANVKKAMIAYLQSLEKGKKGKA